MKNKKVVAEDFNHGGFNSLVKKALEVGVELDYIGGSDEIIRFKFINEVVYVKKNVVPAKRIQAKLSKDKEMTKEVLGDMGIKTPNGIVAKSFEEAASLLKKNKLEYPLIVKPIDGSRAIGVTWEIENEKELKKAVSLVKSGKEKINSKGFVVEEMFIGEEYRVLVFEGKVVSCVHKIPATIIGDGKSTIAELIKEFDMTRREGFKIRIDKVVKETLSQEGFSMNTILDKNRKLRLRYNMNMSDGGRSVECTNIMNECFKDACVKAIKALGLTYGGIDLLAKDVTTENKPYVILEVNSNPFYNMHEKPLIEGSGIDFSAMFLKSMFPELNLK